MIHLLPYQRNYLKDISEYEYNIGYVYEIEEQYTIEVAELKAALLKVVEAQKYLQYVYDNKQKKVVRKSPEEIIEVDSFTMNASEEECFNRLNQLITEKSKALHKEQNFHINITICNTPEKQLISILLDHFFADGGTMAVLPYHIESTLLHNVTMPMHHSVKKVEELMIKHKNVDLEELSYWKYPDANKVLKLTSANLNREQKNVSIKLNAIKTKELFRSIKRNSLKFDKMMLGSFHQAYVDVQKESTDAIEIVKNMREYFKDSSITMTAGPLILLFPIRLEQKTETITDACQLVEEQFKEVKGKELSYSITTSEEIIPRYPSRIIYSNIGSLDKYANASKIFNVSKFSTGYFHGDTFDSELTCDKDLFVRPYSMNGEFSLWLSYNPKRYSTEQIAQIMDQTMEGFVNLVEELSSTEAI